MSTVEKRRPGVWGDLMSWLEDAGSKVSEGSFPVIRLEDFVEDQTYVLRAEIPGVDPDEDIEVAVQDDMLTVSGHKREEVKDKSHREIRYGEFSRSVTVPRGARVDDISASYADGVLEVRLPLEGKPEEAGTRRVPVQRGETSETTGSEGTSQ